MRLRSSKYISGKNWLKWIFWRLRDWFYRHPSFFDGDECAQSTTIIRFSSGILSKIGHINVSLMSQCVLKPITNTYFSVFFICFFFLWTKLTYEKHNWWLRVFLTKWLIFLRGMIFMQSLCDNFLTTFFLIFA